MSKVYLVNVGANSSDSSRARSPSFAGQRGWYLIGALRVSEILEEGQTLKDAKRANRMRAAKNVHLVDGVIGDGQRVFIGSKRRSRLFRRAVDLQTTQGSGLLFRT